MPPREEPKLVEVKTRVPQDVRDRLRRLAESEDRSVSSELRRVIRDHVEGRDQEVADLPASA